VVTISDSFAILLRCCDVCRIHPAITKSDAVSDKARGGEINRNDISNLLNVVCGHLSV